MKNSEFVMKVANTPLKGESHRKNSEEFVMKVANTSLKGERHTEKIIKKNYELIAEETSLRMFIQAVSFVLLDCSYFFFSTSGI